jgi:hypothetical protein
MRRLLVRLSFLFLILCFFPGWRVFGQASAGYIQIGTVAGSACPTGTATCTFTWTTPADGGVYTFEVIPVNLAGEGTGAPSTVTTIPSTGTHTVDVNFPACAVDATHSAPAQYVIYEQETFPPNPEVAPSIVVH